MVSITRPDLIETTIIRDMKVGKSRMAMDLKEQFGQALEEAKSLPSQSNEVLLELYGLFKQATQGDAEGERPGGFDFRGVAKFDAWNARRGMSTEEAMQGYAELVRRLASASE